MPPRKIKTNSSMNLEAVPKFTEADKRAQILGAWCRSITPLEKLDLAEWSDKYRRLPSDTSSEPGRWRTDRFPFLRRIMQCLSPGSRAKEVVAIKGAQLGFTEICINWMLYTADMNPGPFMYVQKTVEAADDFASQKLEPSIAATEKVYTTLGAGKPKSLSNETTNKGFPGGFIVMGGSNSGAFLRSKSIRDACEDEEDSFKANVDGEGSPDGLISKRQANFPAGKKFRLSTPKFKETSTIEPAFMAGSQERYYVPCPECNPHALHTGTYWTIEWRNIKYSKELDNEGEPVQVGLVCEQCGCLIEEHRKTWMLENGRWLTEKNSPGVPIPAGDVRYPSFQISSLYSPLGFFSWRAAVREWLKYLESKDKALLQVFVNQTLGETYSAAGQDISSGWLHSRRERYGTASSFLLPEGCLVLTLGADIQADRIECEVVAWGLGEESWSVEYRVFWGPTDYLGDRQGLDQDGNPTVWALFDEFMATRWRTADGRTLGIECKLLDAGYRTEVVHLFCRTREQRRVWPVKGHEGWGRGFIERPKHRTEKYKTWAFKAWVDEIKDLVYANLAKDSPGPGYCHFPDTDNYTEKYFHGLTAENKKIKQVSGKRVMFWECPAHVRNEPLDCRNYATAALKVLDPNLEYRAKTAAAQSGMVGAESSLSNLAPKPAPKRRVLSKGIQ